MKKTIVLKIEYLDTKKLNKEKESEARLNMFKLVLKDFKIQMKDYEFKIIKEFPDDGELIIDFLETNWENINAALIKSDSVLIIDSFIQENRDKEK